MNDKSILLKNIKPNNYNPNEMNDTGFSELVQELKHLGKPPKPIILRKVGEQFVIVDGEHSYKALLELGFKELQQGWYEIVNFDEFEAMRQTYKRNLGGENNPVKLGLMFEKALSDTKKSIRQLAKEWEISEGTIRNNLLYSEVIRLRSDYAFFPQLTQDQIRYYLKLSKISNAIADFWLVCGAIEDALIIYSNESFNTEKAKYPDIFAIIGSSFKNIIDQGFDKTLKFEDVIPPNNISRELSKRLISKFKKTIKTLNRKAYLKKRLEQLFSWDKGIGKETINEYLEIFFNNQIFIDAPYWFLDSVYSSIIKKEEEKLELLLTPKELRHSIELEKGQSYTSIADNVKLTVAKKLNIAPSEIKGNQGLFEHQMNLLEVSKKAPDYVKQAKYPINATVKAAFISIPFENDEQRKTAWDTVVDKYLHGKEFDHIADSNTQEYQEMMENILDEKEQKYGIGILLNKSELELAGMFIEKIHGDKVLVDKLANNFQKDFLIKLYMLGDMNDLIKRTKSMLKPLASKNKK